MSARAIALDGFNQWISWALQDLDRLPELTPVADYPSSRRLRLESAHHALTNALKRANQTGCTARKAMCLRVLNWVRADLRRISA